jgi:hypothetical protein
MYQEEADRALGKSKSISFNDLLKVTHIKRVICAMVCMTINFMISRGMQNKILANIRHSDQGSRDKLGISNILNADLVGGMLLMIIGYSSSFKFFSGRRITLIVGSIFLVIFWNIFWVLLSEINVTDSQIHFTESDLQPFDTVMYRGECALTFMVYQLILCAGPIDISK